MTEQSSRDNFQKVIQNIRTNREYLRTVERSILINWVFAMLLTGVVCVKHEGFDEEREWRAIYSPGRRPSSLMESSIEVVSGIPQIVHKIPVDGTVSEILTDLDFSKMFERLIIGPSAYPLPMRDAFVNALRNAGVADANDRVFISHIPIRA